MNFFNHWYRGEGYQVDRLENRWKSLCLKTFLSGALREAHQENQGKEKLYHTENNMARKYFVLSRGLFPDAKSCFPTKEVPLTEAGTKSQFGAFPSGLVVKNPPAIQETRVRSLVLEHSTCCGITKPMSHSYWASALEPRNHNY